MCVEIRGAAAEEWPEICDVVNRAFDAESHGPGLDDPWDDVGNSRMDPHHRPENTRLLLVDKQIVSVVHVAERETRLAGQRFPFGFVGMVATHPEHRRRGHMRRLMANAEDHMRSRGFCYGLLMGAWRYYAGGLGWRPIWQGLSTLPWKYIVPTRAEARRRPLRARPATADDIAFLSQAYHFRYASRLGPVVRSCDYWRQWALQRTSEGAYVMSEDDDGPVGYFHISRNRSTVDEIGWTPETAVCGEQIFLTASSWAAADGRESVCFYVDDVDEALRPLREVFGNVPRTYTTPLGKPADGPDPRLFLPANWPDGCGLLTKFLTPGPGTLADVRDTDDLTDAMARHDWTYFDHDTL